MQKNDIYRVLFAVPESEHVRYRDALKDSKFQSVFLPDDSDVISHFLSSECRMLVIDIDPLENRLIELIMAFLDRIEVLPPILFLTSEYSRDDIASVIKFDEADVFTKDPNFNFLAILPHLIDKAVRRSRFQSQLERQDFELQRKNETLTEENALLFIAISAFDDPFFVINTEDYTVSMTNRPELKNGFTEPLYCYQMIHGLNLPCRSSGLECTIDSIRASGNSEVSIDHELKDKSGAETRCVLRALPVLGENNRLVRIVEFVKKKT
ncbi:MAG: hypothetical protein A2Y33_09775 [Spirochaetes bacterium GWF1_51_8]|nr:MAG: hypothetical protein A2Y33_09775 [Spirochaetes bacterium GWF1_51_8]